MDDPTVVYLVLLVLFSVQELFGGHFDLFGRLGSG